jgi:hypothetical protein
MVFHDADRRRFHRRGRVGQQKYTLPPRGRLRANRSIEPPFV